jgi:hypothetical protein
MERKRTLSFIAAVIALSASVCSLVCAADYRPPLKSEIPSAAQPAESAAEADAGDFSPRIFRLWNGKAAVFLPGAETPEQVLAADCDSLPDDVADRLEEGIYAYTREQYYSYLEDFS